MDKRHTAEQLNNIFKNISEKAMVTVKKTIFFINYKHIYTI